MAAIDFVAVPVQSTHDLILGRCRQEVLCRLLRFWDSRNIKRDNEFMGITMLFLDEKLQRINDRLKTKLSDLKIKKLSTRDNQSKSLEKEKQKTPNMIDESENIFPKYMKETKIRINRRRSQLQDEKEKKKKALSGEVGNFLKKKRPVNQR